MTDFEAILRWLAVVSAISVALLPLTLWLGGGLGDSAIALIRPLGMVFLTAIVWWPAAMLGLPFTRLVLLVALAGAATLGWALQLRVERSLPWRELALFEAVWLLLFFGYALFRSYNPHIMNTEKPMEIAFLSSIVRSAEVPAPDPWYAGETINYYYFGYQMIGGIAKLAGIPPSLAFNLALATLFASAGTVAAAIGIRLAWQAGVRRRWMQASTGFVATFMLLWAGNLETIRRVFVERDGLFETTFWYQGVGWQASRIIVDHNVHGRPGERGTINEFPAFSFILGDLHPHVLTYPLLLAVVALAAGFMLARETLTLPRVAVSGGVVGLLYVSNSWDAPLGMLLLVVAFTVCTGFDLRKILTNMVCASAAALVVATPFVLDFTAPVGLNEADVPEFLTGIPVISTVVTTLGIVVWRPSGWGELLTVHGHWIIASAMFAWLAVCRDSNLPGLSRSQRRFAIGGMVVALILALVWSPAIVLIGIPLAGSLLIACRSSSQPVRIVAALFATGFFLILVPEFIYIQDAFGDRMNTVFKFYFQAWAVLAIATAGMVGIGLADAGKQKLVSLAGVALIVLITLPYTPISARDWTDGFEARRGLDGAAWMGRTNPDDAAAIAWLREHAPDDAVIVEGPGCSYQTTAGLPHNRFSAFSGVPTILGWAGHQSQWRRGEDDPIGERIRTRQTTINQWLNGMALDGTLSPASTYLILGSQERLGSSTCDSLPQRDVEASRLALESIGWEVVFQAGDTLIMAQ